MNANPKTLYSTLAAIGLCGGGYFYWQYTANNPSTDNAYLNANRVNVNANISGQVQSVFAKDNQLVKKGELLFTINDAPLRIALKQANAQVKMANIALESDKKALITAKAAITQAQAQLKLDTKNTARIHSLVKKGDVSLAENDRNEAQFQASHAALTTRKQQYQQALLAQNKDKALLKLALAQQEQAKLALSYTQVKAPIAGKITQLNLQKGNMIRQGQAVFSIIDQTQWWVDANFKETQLKQIRPGQSATIVLDMRPTPALKGTVESISPATGNSFSLLPAENAAGNWVKITQRIPVKIILAPTQQPLTLGASANVTVHTKTS